MSSDNIFLFKKRDALMWMLREYEEVRNLVTLVDIKDTPHRQYMNLIYLFIYLFGSDINLGVLGFWGARRN
jgi:hypothetical protein